MKSFEILPTASDHYLVRLDDMNITKHDHTTRYLCNTNIGEFNDLKAILKYTVNIDSQTPEEAVKIFKNKGLHNFKQLHYADFVNQFKSFLSGIAELRPLKEQIKNLSINVYSIQEVNNGILDDPYITIASAKAYKEYARLAVEECGFRLPSPRESFEDYRSAFSEYDDYDNPDLEYNRDDYELHFSIVNIPLNINEGV